MPDCWPYLTDDIPPIPAAFKRETTDFQVEEVPLYDPCGEGPHVYALIEKTNLSTRRAVAALAQAFGIRPDRIGVAGQKDARGITRQLVSLEGVDPIQLRRLTIPGLRVLETARHRTKLRLGAVRENRFLIRLRDVPADRRTDLRRLLASLARRGVPNYFGPQRFGSRGDTWEIGRSLIRQEFPRALSMITGQPAGPDPEVARREIFRLDRRRLGFYVSAYQAWLFNGVLAERLGTLDTILPGDVAYEHLTGRLLPAGDPVADGPRAARLEISPTGPILGHSMPEPAGEAARRERLGLERAGGLGDVLPRTGPLKCIGTRRPLRFLLGDVDVDAGADAAGNYLELRLTLAAGCYATAVLREVCKGATEG
jgi:tRNA pseudouridine13 synthase